MQEGTQYRGVDLPFHQAEIAPTSLLSRPTFMPTKDIWREARGPLLGPPRGQSRTARRGRPARDAASLPEASLPDDLASQLGLPAGILVGAVEMVPGEVVRIA